MRKIIFIIVSCLFGVCNLTWGQGSSYTGSYTRSPRIEYSNKSNIIIMGIEIANPTGHSISLTNCSNITIQNCKLGPSKKEGIYLYKCKNVTITNCSIEKVESGVLAVSSSGIKFEYNEVKNVQGPYPRGQMIQFVYVNGSGNSISFNVSENILGQSYPEDIINMYMSSGTADSPINICNNWIRGGGPSFSGGGIMLGDSGGSYILVENNILVDPGQYGIGISSGHHITVRNNKVYGRKQEFTNVGIYAWEQYKLGCHDISISNNEVNYVNKIGEEVAYWNGGNCGVIEGWYTNISNSQLNAYVLPARIIDRAMISAPTWTSGWPSATEVVQNGFTACVNLNEAGNSYYVVLPTGSVSPNSNQVKAGKDANGNPLSDAQKGIISCELGAFEYKSPISGLTENNSYDVYFVAENKELILQQIPLRIVVTVHYR
ncbi:MAG: right-handed parallel beta-helix repeat-containing protein [Paludibacter sp.]